MLANYFCTCAARKSVLKLQEAVRFANLKLRHAEEGLLIV